MDIFSNIRMANVGITDLKIFCSLFEIRPDPEREETMLELHEMVENQHLYQTVLIEAREECGFLWEMIETLEKIGYTALLLNRLRNVYEIADSWALSPRSVPGEISKDSLIIQISAKCWMSMSQWDLQKEAEPWRALDPFLLTSLSFRRMVPC